MVYGVLAEESVDKTNEVFDYARSKPHFQEWSREFSKRTSGKSKGNLRRMHQPHVAGHFTELVFNDDGKRIEVAAKVTDDQDWAKCLEGDYTGFSIGGKYMSTWHDDQLNAKRYEAKPAEGSLVDNPAMFGAGFTLVRSGGSEELVKFRALSSLLKASDVQSVIFSRDKGDWTVAKAKAWLKDHDLKAPDPDETENTWRFRQFDPDRCTGGEKTLSENLPEGIQMFACSVADASKVIRKEGDEWVLYDSKGEKVLGRHKSRESAMAQDRAIQAKKKDAGEGDLKKNPELSLASELASMLASFTYFLDRASMVLTSGSAAMQPLKHAAGDLGDALMALAGEGVFEAVHADEGGSSHEEESEKVTTGEKRVDNNDDTKPIEGLADVIKALTGQSDLLKLVADEIKAVKEAMPKTAEDAVAKSLETALKKDREMLADLVKRLAVVEKTPAAVGSPGQPVDKTLGSTPSGSVRSVPIDQIRKFMAEAKGKLTDQQYRELSIRMSELLMPR